ncbi:MAG TPA: tRNA (adenosine(37)-N6)-threonylcarbamoyltransferase complex ATPase subunit type 1 TsaE, partial [Polyangia bacterium]|nr:tRNA (adenosine(37)-N6)-threonylcarbamoyltransferase complex ATPase subunit type 1 TsaE [Polyangia bacterium]
MANAGPEQNRRPSATATVMANDADDMRRLGVRLGQAMGVGDVVALVGPLGAGKTTFAQGLAQGLGVAPHRHVASPSFALVNEHPGRTPFVHVDFYRLRTRAELPELGIEEAYDRAATAIEWADRFPDVLPADHLQITLAVQVSG